jgi:hypothetical protein
MRKTITFILFFAAIAIAKSDDHIISAPNFAPFAMTAKQIAPGTSRIFSLSTSSANRDSCNIPQKEAEDLYGSNFRFDLSLFSFTWPKTANTKGAENWTGHTFGGGVFLNTHYALPLEIGLSPTIVQWMGPFYIGATYQLTLGHYFGKDEDNKMTIHINSNKFTGSFNIGGGAMVFMNNHGWGFGTHGGMRDTRIINPGYRIYTGTDYRSGKKTNPEERPGYQKDDRVYYYGLDFLLYSNLPLLDESNSKGHSGFLTSIEVGVRPHVKSTPFWSLSFSLSL